MAGERGMLVSPAWAGRVDRAVKSMVETAEPKGRGYQAPRDTGGRVASIHPFRVCVRVNNNDCQYGVTDSADATTISGNAGLVVPVYSAEVAVSATAWTTFADATAYVYAIATISSSNGTLGSFSIEKKTTDEPMVKIESDTVTLRIKLAKLTIAAGVPASGQYWFTNIYTAMLPIFHPPPA